MPNIVNISSHPLRVLEEIRQAANDLSSVRFSENINDLSLARRAPMSAVWACLEQGQIDRQHTHREPNGMYAKLFCDFAGSKITVDIMLDNTKVLHVLFAEAEEY